jgi:hypothetical protein
VVDKECRVIAGPDDSDNAIHGGNIVQVMVKGMIIVQRKRRTPNPFCWNWSRAKETWVRSRLQSAQATTASVNVRGGKGRESGGGSGEVYVA